MYTVQFVCLFVFLIIANTSVSKLYSCLGELYILRDALISTQCNRAHSQRILMAQVTNHSYSNNKSIQERIKMKECKC